MASSVCEQFAHKMRSLDSFECVVVHLFASSSSSSSSSSVFLCRGSKVQTTVNSQLYRRRFDELHMWLETSVCTKMLTILSNLRTCLCFAAMSAGWVSFERSKILLSWRLIGNAYRRYRFYRGRVPTTTVTIMLSRRIRTTTQELVGNNLNTITSTKTRDSRYRPPNAASNTTRTLRASFFSPRSFPKRMMKKNVYYYRYHQQFCEC